MKVVGFDGRQYSLSFSKKPLEKCSKGHARCRKLLKEVFPFDIIYEQVTLKGSKTHRNKVLYADFIVPSQKEIIEVDGKQHDGFSSRFHGTKLGFLKSKTNDKIKEEYANINGLTLIRLKDSETEEEWKRKILDAS